MVICDLYVYCWFTECGNVNPAIIILFNEISPKNLDICNFRTKHLLVVNTVAQYKSVHDWSRGRPISISLNFPIQMPLLRLTTLLCCNFLFVCVILTQSSKNTAGIVWSQTKCYFQRQSFRFDLLTDKAVRRIWMLLYREHKGTEIVIKIFQFSNYYIITNGSRHYS